MKELIVSMFLDLRQKDQKNLIKVSKSKNINLKSWYTKYNQKYLNLKPLRVSTL